MTNTITLQKEIHNVRVQSQPRSPKRLNRIHSSTAVPTDTGPIQIPCVGLVSTKRITQKTFSCYALKLDKRIIISLPMYGWCHLPLQLTQVLFEEK